ILSSTIPLPHITTQFPYTTLFRSERNVRRPHVIVKDVKCLWAAPSSAQRMPLRRQTSAANMDRSLVKDKSIRVAEDAHEICRKRSEEHTSELQSRSDLVCRLLLEK